MLIDMLHRIISSTIEKKEIYLYKNTV